MVAHHPEYMSFEEFQSTRKRSERLEDAIHDESVSGPGFTYLNEQLYIEEMKVMVVESGYEMRMYYLMLDRTETFSDDLFALERKLYDWAVRECYITDLEGEAYEGIRSEDVQRVRNLVEGHLNCTNSVAIHALKNEEMKSWYLHIEILESHTNIFTSQALNMLLSDLRMNKTIDGTAQQMWVGKSSRGNLLLWCVGGKLPEVPVKTLDGRRQYTISVHDEDGVLIKESKFDLFS